MRSCLCVNVWIHERRTNSISVFVSCSTSALGWLPSRGFQRRWCIQFDVYIENWSHLRTGWLLKVSRDRDWAKVALKYSALEHPVDASIIGISVHYPRGGPRFCWFTRLAITIVLILHFGEEAAKKWVVVVTNTYIATTSESARQKMKIISWQMKIQSVVGNSDLVDFRRESEEKK